jgi:hypothetical protein
LNQSLHLEYKKVQHLYAHDYPEMVGWLTLMAVMAVEMPKAFVLTEIQKIL